MKAKKSPAKSTEVYPCRINHFLVVAEQELATSGLPNDIVLQQRGRRYFRSLRCWAEADGVVQDSEQAEFLKSEILKGIFSDEPATLISLCTFIRLLPKRILKGIRLT